MPEVSTKPYLVRAIYEWCADSGYRPFIAVVVDGRTRVPREFVRNGEIVLNISPEATNRLHIGNELLEFEARFGGVARHVSIPIDNVRAIFAQENGHGMAFEVPVREQGGNEAHETGSAAGASEQPARASGEEQAAPGHRASREGGSAIDDGAEGNDGVRTPAKRAAAKRARKTVLREVRTPPPPDEAGQGEPAHAESGSPKGTGSSSGRRPRKPTIAAVPRNADADPGGGKAHTGRPRGPDDDPGPGTTPGKPRLTRIK